MSEFIGSRISLISKSDIKYIGTLHEINSESSTVALENVTSYGTQGRRGNPADELAGTDQVYEYIVFRGSDVKELQIVEGPQTQENKRPAVPDDPAIMGSTRPPGLSQQQQPPPFQQQPPQQFRQQPPPPQPYGYPPGPPPNQFQQQPRFQGPGGPHGFPGSPGAVPGYHMPYGPPPPGYGPPPPGYGHPPGHGFPQHPSGPFPQQDHMPPPQQGQQRAPPGPGQIQTPAPAESKQGTSQPSSSNPSSQPPSQQPSAQKPADRVTAPVEMAAPTPPPPKHAPAPPMESKPSPAAALAPPTESKQPQAAPQAVKRPQNARVAVPRPSPNTASKNIAPQTAPVPQPALAQPQTYVDATSAATAAVAAAMAKLNTSVTNNRPASHGATSNGLDNLTQRVDQMRMQERGRGSRSNRGARGGGGRGGARGVDVPKEDYDFASANAKFNKTDVVKEAIASGSPLASPNGEHTDPLASDAGNGHGNSVTVESEDVVIPAKDTSKGYDKSTSFFDNISSDLKDRSENSRGGFDGRAMRTQERSRNLETFGAVGVDGGFRGRARGRGMGFRGRGRGFEARGGAERGFGINGRGGRGRGDEAGLA